MGKSLKLNVQWRGTREREASLLEKRFEEEGNQISIKFVIERLLLAQ